MKEFTTKAFMLFVFVQLITLSINAQKEFDSRGAFVEAESYFLFEEYSDALPLYQRILSEEPENYNVKYKVGICYLNDPYQKGRSIKYLEDASKHVTEKYRINSFKEKLAPHDALYYLGQAYRVNGELNKAIDTYKQFKAIVNPELYNFDVVNADLASCEVAKKSTKNPVYHRVGNMGEGVNTRFAETNAILSGDGKTLIFTRKLQFYDAVFISELGSDGKWTVLKNLTEDFGVDGNTQTTGLSYNGDEIFVYRSDNFDGNIYSSKKVDGKWQRLKKLNDNINTKYWESHASISANGQELYFTSNRKGTYGGLDIYRSTKDAQGEWGVPVNLGPTVNSKYNEEAPFISPGDDKLYFSSLGHNGMGGYDIYIAEKIGAGKWSRPVNMGYPFNTTDDDIFFCPTSLEGLSGVYSIYQPENTYGLKDVFWVEIYNEMLPRTFTVKGHVNAPTQELFENENITVSLVNTVANAVVSQVAVDENGDFALETSQGKYQLVIDGEGIKPISVPLVLDVAQDNSDINLEALTAEAVAVGKDVPVELPDALPILELVGDEYLMVDTTPVLITLKVEPNSDLKVENYVGDKLVNTEEYHLSKDKFTYVLTPEEGENRVVFTLIDSEGNKSTKEVMVYYTPVEEAIALDETITEEVVAALPEVALLAGAGLQSYLIGLGDVSFDSKSELYDVLIANAETQNYTVEDVNRLFSIMLSQRDKEEFLEALYKTDEFTDAKLSDSLLDAMEYPLVIVEETKQEFGHKQPELDKGLIKVVPYNASPDAELAYISSFGDISLAEGVVGSDNASEQLAALKASASSQVVDSTLNLASTTKELEFFYQNLLYQSEGKMAELLKSADFEKHDIDNSIDLVSYLIRTAPEYGISPSDLIRELDKKQAQQNQNLIEFKEALAAAATGELKVAIENIDINKLATKDFEGIINELLKQSKNSGYSPSEVYDLLISMLGVDKASELAALMRGAGANSDLDSLLSSLSMDQFSTPLELVQYLLSQSPYYDYTDSDINNLLLRLLLEKGMDNFQQSEEALQAAKIEKRRKVITSIVLANAILILLLIIFKRRSNKKKDN